MIRTTILALAVALTTTQSFAGVISEPQIAIDPAWGDTGADQLPLELTITEEVELVILPLTGGQSPPYTPSTEGSTSVTESLFQLVCTDVYLPDGKSKCDFINIPAEPPNPVTCTLRETADGIVSTCTPTGGSGAGGVPAPGGLLVMLAALGFALRKKFVPSGLPA